MKLDTPKPTRASLFAEGLAVRTLAEAEELRRRFMRQHQLGVKAWADFAESVEAARKTLNHKVK